MKPHAVKTDRVSYNINEVYTNSAGKQYEVRSLSAAVSRKLIKDSRNMEDKSGAYIIWSHTFRRDCYLGDKSRALTTIRTLCNDWQRG